MFGTENQIFVPYSVGRSTCSLVDLQFAMDINNINGCGFSYAKFTIVTTVGQIVEFKKSDLKSGPGHSIEHICLMLPYRSSPNELFQMTYSMLSHEWLNLTVEGKWESLRCVDNYSIVTNIQITQTS